MKVQYIAEDGTVFDTEVECKDHELRTAFGSDARFVNAVDDMLSPLAVSVERGWLAIHFDSDEDKIRVAVAIAQHFESLSNNYDISLDDFNRKTRPSKRRARK